MFSDPGAIETATFNFGLSWAVGSVNYSLPTPQYIQAQAQLAPWSGNQNPQIPTPAPSADTSIPRFVNNPGAPINTSYLTGCQCDLLFPYVVDDPGALATGIAIANTTSDPYISTTVVSPSPTLGVIPRGHSATPTSGYVSLFFYPNFTTAKNYPTFTTAAGTVTTTVGTPIVQTTLLPIPTGDQLC